MLDSGLFRLFQLHLVDAALHELKSHAGALDLGQAENAALKERLSATEEIRALPKKLRQEQTDLELEQKSLQDKRALLNKKVYGGSVVSPKEIMAMETEIASLGVRIDGLDERQFEILEALPDAEAKAKEIERELALLKRTIQEKQALAKSEHESLKESYAATVKKRPPALAKVSPHLVEQYEVLRTRIGTPAMAVITKNSSCGACGILLPERVMELVRQDRVVNCESCRRILFSPMPGAE
jgi:uncharacterized protein